MMRNVLISSADGKIAVSPGKSCQSIADCQCSLDYQTGTCDRNADDMTCRANRAQCADYFQRATIIDLAF